MKRPLKIIQVDAFAQTPFTGNPAAVIYLEKWLDDDLMQKIAMEINLSETAFFVDKGDHFHLRWFTPKSEVRLCGHATLATSHALFKHLAYKKEQIKFKTLGGELLVEKKGDDQYQVSFPADIPKQIELTDALQRAVPGIPISEVFFGLDDYLVITESQEIVEAFNPAIAEIKALGHRGLLLSAPGNEVDFVSRCFFPNYGIDEDPVTGSAHTLMTPYWADRLGKNHMTAMQLSDRRGWLKCEIVEEKVKLTGKAITTIEGQVYL